MMPQQREVVAWVEGGEDATKRALGMAAVAGREGALVLIYRRRGPAAEKTRTRVAGRKSMGAQEVGREERTTMTRRR